MRVFAVRVTLLTALVAVLSSQAGEARARQRSDVRPARAPLIATVISSAGPRGGVPVTRHILISARRAAALMATVRSRLPTAPGTQVLSYSTYLDGRDGHYTVAAGVAVDAAGAAYITGVTTSLDLPTTPHSFHRDAPGGGDAFVAKLAPSGDRLIYVTYLGGRGLDGGAAIAVDPAGAAYVVGATASPDFPTTPGAIQRSRKGKGAQGFIAKLSSDGGRLLYSTYLGGRGTQRVRAIAVDKRGAAYVAGESNSPDFPITRGAVQRRNKGHGYAPFVVKLAPGGHRLAYATFLSGSTKNADSAAGIAIDRAGAAYVTGVAGSRDFPATRGAFQPARGEPGEKAYLAKISPDGRRLIYSAVFGGRGHTMGNAIAVDAAGAAYVTGATTALDFPTTRGAFQTLFTSPGETAAFVIKLSPNGKRCLYATYLGGRGNQRGLAIAADSAGRANVVGETNAVDFPTTNGAFQMNTRGGADDAFLVRLEADGKRPLYSTYLAGKGFQQGLGVALDAAGAVYITGDTTSQDFPITLGSAQTRAHGAQGAAFITKLALPGQ